MDKPSPPLPLLVLDNCWSHPIIRALNKGGKTYGIFLSIAVAASADVDVLEVETGQSNQYPRELDER